MVFASGRGRPPTATIESGAVSWDENSDCFVGENGYYWHGTKYGGWRTEKPTKKERRTTSVEQRSGSPSTPGTPTVRKGRMPRPPGTGMRVSFDVEEDCYKTDGGLYWHGSTALGQRGWTDYPPSQADNHEMPIPDGKKSRRGRPPACEPAFGTHVYYDTEESFWKTDQGYFWTGSIQLGGRGWVKIDKRKKKKSNSPPRKRTKKKANKQVDTDDDGTDESKRTKKKANKQVDTADNDTHDDGDDDGKDESSENNDNNDNDGHDDKNEDVD